LFEIRKKRESRLARWLMFFQAAVSGVMPSAYELVPLVRFESRNYMAIVALREEHLPFSLNGSCPLPCDHSEDLHATAIR
jgi:hypothetical protein